MYSVHLLVRGFVHPVVLVGLIRVPFKPLPGGVRKVRVVRLHGRGEGLVDVVLGFSLVVAATFLTHDCLTRRLPFE